VATGAGWTGGSEPVSNLTMPATYFLGRLFGVFTTMATLFYLLATLDFLDLKRITADPARTREKRLLYRAGTLPAGMKVKGWFLTPVSGLPLRDEGDLYYDLDRARADASGVPPFRKNLLAIPPRDRPFSLDHADFITKRRSFYRGLERLLKICHASTFRNGSGFIMVPHCYFVEGLHRDDQNEHIDEDRIIGPDFQTLWGIRVRRFLFDVLEAMDLDIIYFEDKIRFPQLREVFEVIFELYHSRGSHFRIEEYHFIGLTGMRTIVETIRPDLPREKNAQYPETHFSNLSMARILVVFKDRGGDRDPTPVQTPGMSVPEWI
jgi:hypothetical protein